jgi:hypothetical protein
MGSVTAKVILITQRFLFAGLAKQVWPIQQNIVFVFTQAHS